MNFTSKLVMRILAAVLVIPLIADYIVFTVNNLTKNPGFLSASLVVFYILDIIALIAVAVGAAIGKYAISIIGIIAYAAIYLISMISQLGEFNHISAFMIAQWIPLLVTVVIAALLGAKMIKAKPAAIVFICCSVISLILTLVVRTNNHLKLFSWANIKYTIIEIWVQS